VGACALAVAATLSRLLKYDALSTLSWLRREAVEAAPTLFTLCTLNTLHKEAEEAAFLALWMA
jgi:hypothetical protein